MSRYGLPELSSSSSTGAMNASSSTSNPNASSVKERIHINIAEIGTCARIGQLQPTYAFNLDMATRRSAKDIARDRLYDTGFPRVTRAPEPDAEMLESARRAVSARGSARDSVVAKASSRELAKELDVVSGGGGFNLSLLSSSRYYHSAQSTMTGQSDVTKKSPRNTARQFIQQQTQLPYGREAFDGISDTCDSIYGADYSRRYVLNAPARYSSSIEVLKNENRPNLKERPEVLLATCKRGDGAEALKKEKKEEEEAARTLSRSTGRSGASVMSELTSARVGKEIPPKYLTQTPRGRTQMAELMTRIPRKEAAALVGGYF